MNSHDAAYEESIRELLDATAAEAVPVIDTPAKDRAESVAKTEEPYEEIIEIGPGGRKKRKRAEDDVYACLSSCALHVNSCLFAECQRKESGQHLWPQRVMDLQLLDRTNQRRQRRSLLLSCHPLLLPASHVPDVVVVKRTPQSTTPQSMAKVKMVRRLS